MTRLESYLHYRIFGKPAPKERKPRRKSGRGPARDWKYRAWIRSLPCAICGRQPAEAAHTGTDGGMRLKASDFSCIPLCSNCHTQAPDANHRIGKRAFELKHNISCIEQVKELNRVWFEYSRMVK